ncbi:uncharacterized protein LOC106080598 [Stomoxys calcitrans]|uniref:Uncharacterized protein n=1 Tax=Stomoxys calcitrans TaxID=35570 RepID=A0A1I8QCG0_STOCA|nr:uncharacterized protein LOC106080598 [Stomoxys calcitrans]
MFKKSKGTKNYAAPSAPTAEEILSDIETFQVDIDTAIATTTNNRHSDSTSTSLEKWWMGFEQFINDLKCLEVIQSEIEGYKLKLEAHKLEIETEATLLKNELDEKKAQIDVALKQQ